MERMKAEMAETERQLREVEAGMMQDGEGKGRKGRSALVNDGTVDADNPRLAMDESEALNMLDRFEALSSIEEEDLWPYGWIAASAGDYLSALQGANAASSTTTPPSGFVLAARNFKREFQALKDLIEKKETAAGSPNGNSKLRAKLDKLVLSNDAVWEREHKRPPVRAPWVIKGPYYLLCYMLDALFDGRPIERFWFLETVARMPYFSYISCLHLYESLGWWRMGMQVKRVHAAEEFNEAHHLLTMEALGGDSSWTTRFLGQHSAIVYYWVLVAMWLLSPTLAYNFSELIEAHAVDTYGEFLDANEELLKSLPAPPISRYYYTAETFMFDEFQTQLPAGSRRPVIDSLYDVFEAIRDDEAEHVATMKDCQDQEFMVRSPNYEKFAAAADKIRRPQQIQADRRRPLRNGPSSRQGRLECREGTFGKH